MSPSRAGKRLAARARWHDHVDAEPPHIRGKDDVIRGLIRRRRGSLPANRTIWTCWFQGEDRAPPLVRRCLASWRRGNPGWEVQCLDASTLAQFVDLPALAGKEISPAARSDVLRIHLLRRFGGVWVDATTYCNRPLDDWLAAYFASGFFAFARPAPDREVASWFLAAALGNRTVDVWQAAVNDYWQSCSRRKDDYFWFHHIFNDLCASDPDFARDWGRVPRYSADAPHALQRVGLSSPAHLGDPRIDWHTPVFKLSHHLDERDYRPGTLVWRLLEGETAMGL
ncbi:MAG: hypothetical protein QOF83_406 [Solirubrobacteraceae bacterium]|jgi:hypothetical protein|nr:hypothetical protein [Solirubrobacteraceae bacterium]